VNRLALTIAAAALVILSAGCGGSPGSHVAQLGSTTTTAEGSPSSTSSAQSAVGAALAFSRCMRSHGVPNFPDSDFQGNFPPFHTGVSKQVSVAADDACRHLLVRGGSTGTPQQRREKLVFALKVAQCLRGHGYPTFPDPSGSSQGKPPGIDLNSPQFQTAENNCEKQERKSLGLP
jgi:hypothetical protein